MSKLILTRHIKQLHVKLEIKGFCFGKGFMNEINDKSFRLHLTDVL